MRWHEDRKLLPPAGSSPLNQALKVTDHELRHINVTCTYRLMHNSFWLQLGWEIEEEVEIALRGFVYWSGRHAEARAIFLSTSASTVWGALSVLNKLTMHACQIARSSLLQYSTHPNTFKIRSFCTGIPRKINKKHEPRRIYQFLQNPYILHWYT